MKVIVIKYDVKFCDIPYFDDERGWYSFLY